ncbi:Hypp230 [Branchiostoma lanceolatum]|uniref:Hypp230 protein n=2 Tax=Branchiostoma lanceolatum TaxID=7740 RepID=A0A8J9YNV2_BRALA|nr:Hypp230 [Branchiostoma lanceolatum]
MTEPTSIRLSDNTTYTATSLQTEAINTTTQVPPTPCRVDICTCSTAECSSYIIWAVTGTFLGTGLLCGLIMVLIWRCNLCRFRQVTLERVEERYRIDSLALPPHESLRRVSHRYEGRSRWYAGPGDSHVNLGFQSDETPDDYISGGSRIQMMVENGAVENGHGRAHAHTFHHYRKKESNVSNIYENPMSVKRSSEALAGRYATFPRAEQPQHKLSTASGVYEIPIDWPGDAKDDRKISSVSSYYESPVLQDLEAARHDKDVFELEGVRRESTVSGVYVTPMSSVRYRSNPDMSGIQEEDADLVHRESRRKSTVYDAPMPELPSRNGRRPSPIPELPPRQNSLPPNVATIGTSPQARPRADRTPPPRHLSMAEKLVASEQDSSIGYGREAASDDDQDFEDRDRRRKSTVYDAPMPELPPTAARQVSTPEVSPREAMYKNYGGKNDGDDESFSDEVPPCPLGDAPAPPMGAVPARPTGGAPSPPSSAVPSPSTRRVPTFPELITPALPDSAAPVFPEDLAPAFPDDRTPAAQTPAIRTSLPAYLTRDRRDSVGSMDTLASEPLSERQTHFEMRKIDFDFIPAPDYPEDDEVPVPNEAADRRQHAHSQSLQNREEEYYRGYETNNDADVTFIS